MKSSTRIMVEEMLLLNPADNKHLFAYLNIRLDTGTVLTVEELRLENQFVHARDSAIFRNWHSIPIESITSYCVSCNNNPWFHDAQTLSAIIAKRERETKSKGK